MSAHTVTNPKTMMVVSFYANLALSTMPSSIFTKYFADWAKVPFWFFGAKQIVLELQFTDSLLLFEWNIVVKNRGCINSVALYIELECCNIAAYKYCSKQYYLKHSQSLSIFWLTLWNHTYNMRGQRDDYCCWDGKPIEIVCSKVRLVFLEGEAFGDFVALHIINQKIMTSIIRTIMKQQSIMQVHTWFTSE